MKSANIFWSAERISWKHWVFLFCLLLILRSWSFAYPIVDVDEPQFAGFAHAILDGGVPYIASVDTKPLGIYWFFAAIFAVFGRYNMIAVHVVTALWVGVTAFFCFRICKRLASPLSAFWTALFYIVFTTTFIPKFIGTSIVPVMMLPLTISIDLILIWEERGRRLWLFLAGLAWGVSCLFKYQSGINLVVVGTYFIIIRPLYINRGLGGIRILEFITFLFGGIVVGGLFAAYLHAVGAWDAFAFWSLRGSAAYVEAASEQSHFLRGLVTRGSAVIASALLLWVLTIAECIRLIRDFFVLRLRRPEEVLILIWFLLSIIPVCTGGKFYGHYFVQLYPAMSILVGIWFGRALTEGCKRWVVILVAIGVVVPAVGFTMARLVADRVYQFIGEESPKDYLGVSKYIKARTSEEDSIFVWGFATPIYFYSERPASSRFLWCDWLTGRVSGTPSSKDPNFDTTAYIKPGSWEMFSEDMEESRPVYFVDTSPGNYHDYGKYPISKYKALVDFLQKNYSFETTIDKMDIYRRVVP